MSQQNAATHANRSPEVNYSPSSGHFQSSKTSKRHRTIIPAGVQQRTTTATRKMMSHRYFKILVCHGLLLASTTTMASAALGGGDEHGHREQLQEEHTQRALRPKRVRHRGLIKIGDRQPEDIARNAINFKEEEERILEEEEDILRALQISRELQSMSSSRSRKSRKSRSKKSRTAATGLAQGAKQLFD